MKKKTLKNVIAGRELNERIEEVVEIKLRQERNTLFF
jgi:hypothetical protein